MSKYTILEPREPALYHNENGFSVYCFRVFGIFHRKVVEFFYNFRKCRWQRYQNYYDPDLYVADKDDAMNVLLTMPTTIPRKHLKP